MRKTLAAALVAGIALLGAGAAHAGGHVSWSIGIHTPVVGTVISNGPGYGYGHYAPVPVYAPAPVHYVPVPAPVYYPQVGGYYYRPVPVLYPRYERGHRYYHHRHRHGRGWRHD